MSKQERLTMSKIVKITPEGTAEIITDDSEIEPGQHSFASQETLNEYLIETFGATTQNGGITGTFARTGSYHRRSADGASAITFGDPVFDTISSAEGSVLINNQTFDLSPLLLETNTAGETSEPEDNIVASGASDLKFRGIVNDAERWASDDGSLVQYRIHNGSLNFQAFKKGPSITNLGAWKMGVLISVTGGAFYDGAFINAINFMSVNAPCQQFLTGGSGRKSGEKGRHLELGDWGILAQQPERVAGICMALWHHRQFADLLTAGSGCPNFSQVFGNPTFPAEWTPIPTVVNLNGSWSDGSPRNAVITVSLRTLKIDMSAFRRPTAKGKVSSFDQITATFPDDKSYTGQLSGNVIRWSNGSQWTKVVNTIFDLNGHWSDGSPWVAVILAGAASLTVDMSDFDRPTARGKIINRTTITVTFTDDVTHTGTLISPGTIRWSNGSSWTKKR